MDKVYVRTLLVLALLASLVVALSVGSGAAGASAGQSRSIAASGVTSPTGGFVGSDPAAGVQWPEYASIDSGDAGPAAYTGTIVDRSDSSGSGNGPKANGAAKAKSNPSLVGGFDGLNHRNQRLANGGNQFSVEPPDQGMCVGGGDVVEAVNDVFRVYSTAGSPLTGVIDLNTFYGYAPAINRTTGVRGPFVTDPSCLYDPATQRFFVVVLTLDSHPNGAFVGTNHLDIAVSRTADPTGSWDVYRLPVQDNGTDGTPDHGCSLGFCLGDYPHIGADANGFYITTNEYSFFGPEFKGAQIYALPKAALASGAATVSVTQFDTAGAVAGNPGFTVWPATSPGVNSFATGANGTEYFMSSDAAGEANGNGSSTNLIVWALTNTATLNNSTPSLGLSNTVLTVGQYAIPPKANQKPGDFPLGQCLNDTACSTFLLGAPDPFAPEVESKLDSNDTRMQQVTYANGKLWGALDTALTLNGTNKAGVEWFIVKPSTAAGLSAALAMQGYLGLANNNLTYPAIGVTSSGRGVMAFTVTGDDYFPSAGYASIDAKVGTGPISIAATGAGPADGFTSYKAFVGNPPRTRWGDYGAAAVDGNSIWIASEYINNTCTLAQYEATPFGSCGGTRTSLANWNTRISHLVP